MANTGVLIEIGDQGVKAANFGVLTAAQGYGDTVYALLLNADPQAHKEILGRYGAAKIVNLEGNADLMKKPDLQAKLVLEAINHFQLDALLGLSSSIGRDLMARIAAIKGVPLVQDCLSVNIKERIVKKSYFSGKTTGTLKISAPVFLCSIRPNAIEELVSPVEAEIIPFSAAAEDARGPVVKEVKRSASGKMDLSEANIIITGGRPIGSAENFSLLEKCAEVLGGAVGASRVAVDMGYAPHSMQVGQTGKTVSPKLYIGCGLSGSVQHFAGMKTSKVIVAINTDKDAPIFQKCDYGIIADLFDVVPALTEELSKP